MGILHLILNMANEGYPDSAIMAAVRSRLEAEARAEDDYWSAREQEADRASLAAAVAECDPFAGEAATNGHAIPG